MEKKYYSYRAFARIVIEAVSPMKVGSGKGDFNTDSFIAKDANNLPYIPGTSLCGVLRDTVPEDMQPQFGERSDKGTIGSRIIVSDAALVYEGGKVSEGIMPEKDKTPFLHIYGTLPVRQHVRIGHRGTGENGGKFDEEVVYAGTRFCFELEVLSDKDDALSFLDRVIDAIGKQGFRIGGGTRNGFGKVKVISVKKASLNLKNADDLKAYIQKPSSMNEEWAGWENIAIEAWNGNDAWKDFSVTLLAEDFFLFGSGSGSTDGNVDMTPVREKLIQWNGIEPIINNVQRLLVPATSIKGAISHRTAYHYNIIKGIFADTASPDIIAKSNEAVQSLFGFVNDSKATDKESSAQRGRVLFGDNFIEARSKNLTHVVIDSFTGGGIEGGLFNEEVTFKNDGGNTFTLEILVERAFAEDEKNSDIMKAFSMALDDLNSGMLPLGGGANRGHGRFGSVTDN